MRPGPAVVRPDGLLRDVSPSGARRRGGIGTAPRARRGPSGRSRTDAPPRGAAPWATKPPPRAPARTWRLDLFSREVPVRATARRLVARPPTPTPANAVAASALSTALLARPARRTGEAHGPRTGATARGTRRPRHRTRPGTLRSSRGPRSRLCPPRPRAPSGEGAGWATGRAVAPRSGTARPPRLRPGGAVIFAARRPPPAARRPPPLGTPGRGGGVSTAHPTPPALLAREGRSLVIGAATAAVVLVAAGFLLGGWGWSLAVFGAVFLAGAVWFFHGRRRAPSGRGGTREETTGAA